MLSPEELVFDLHEAGFSFFSGVPCSFLKGMINCAIDQGDYIMAANEGDAVAICAGAYMAGRRPVILMQNSGLANAISPLTSLTRIFRIPVFGFVSLRGEAHTGDEPQHDLMGRITIPLLELMGIRWEFLSSHQMEAKEQVKRAGHYFEQGESFFLVVRRNILGSAHGTQASPPNPPPQEVYQTKRSKSGQDELPLRTDVLKALNSSVDQNTAIITPTGYTSREWYEIDDRQRNFYMVGSMGCAGSIGLGIVLAQPERGVVVIDGDGALLMRLGIMPTIGQYGPKNLFHVVLDNNAYESTGGQKTVSERVNFVDIAHACGYTNSVYIHSLNELQEHILEWKKHHELTFLYLKIREGTKEGLGRPSISPFAIRQRFMEFLND
jgi:phosphonopyruvate decarboxylase